MQPSASLAERAGLARDNAVFSASGMPPVQRHFGPVRDRPAREVTRTGYRAWWHGCEPITAVPQKRLSRYDSRRFQMAGPPASRRRTRPVAGKKDRQRRLARERLARQQARRSQQAHKTRVRAIATGVVCVVAALGVGGYFLLGTSGSRSSASSEATPKATPKVTPVATSCSYTKSGSAARTVNLPPSKPDSTATYQATIATNRGTIFFDLVTRKA